MIMILSVVLPNMYRNAYGAYAKATPLSGGPIINNPNLKTELVAKGLRFPTSMAFLGPSDILVLEKNEGTVRRVTDGKLVSKPLLQVNVGKQVEWGMLGIAVEKQNDNTFVFLRYTAIPNDASTSSNSRSSSSSSNSNQNPDSMRNLLYKYELVGNKLVNPTLLMNLPATSPLLDSGASTKIGPPENNHDGGKVLIGPDNNVYTAIGDVGGHKGQAQNVKDGDPLDGTSGILRVDQNGKAPLDNPLMGVNEAEKSKDGQQRPMSDYYYAYGVRNSFGMDFDPVTGKLWDTENGPNYGDEINLVEGGSNSGWLQVMGIWKVSGQDPGPDISSKNPPPHLLLDFGNSGGKGDQLKGKYMSPEFVWKQPIGPTALKFLNSDKLGKQYQNTIFVGDVNTGNLYNFKLNPQRTGLLLDGPLADKVADNPDELSSVIFGKGFGVITDIQVGPGDGYLYILTYQGTIYRIVPSHAQ